MLVSKTSIFSRLVPLAVLTPMSLILAGCGMVTTATTESNGVAPVAGQRSSAGISGLVHGGQQPVTGAYVQLYAVGSGFGNGATPLIPTSSSGTPDGSTQSIIRTDSNGNFVITNDFTCPSSATQVYITAVGGNPGLPGNSTNNTNIALMAALGNCGSLSGSTTIIINEATTVAAVWALQNFINIPFSNNPVSFWEGGGSCTKAGSGTAASPYSCSSSAPATGFSISSSATNTQGLLNAFAQAAILANPYTGTSPGANTSGTATNVESWNVYGIANILSACVNQSSNNSLSNCSTLLGSGGTQGTATAVNYSSGTNPLGGTLAYATYTETYTPQDTLQAAWMMARNPATNVANLFALASSTPAWVGASTMNDFTIGYQIASAYGGGSVSPSGTSNYLASPSYIAFDKYGNAFVSNLDINGPTNGTATYPYQPFISEFDPAGNPLTKISSYCLSSSTTNPFGNGTVNYGSYNSTTATFTYSYRIPMYMVFDGNNNLYAYDEAAGYILQVPGSAAAGTATTYTGVSGNCSGYSPAFATPTAITASASIATSNTIGVKGLAVDSTNNILWVNFKGNSGTAVNGVSASDSGILNIPIATEFVSSPPALGSGNYTSANSGDFGIAIDNHSFPTAGAEPGPVVYFSDGSACALTGDAQFPGATSGQLGAIISLFSGSGKFNGTGNSVAVGGKVASLYDSDDTTTSTCGTGLTYSVGLGPTAEAQYFNFGQGSYSTSAEPIGNPLAIAVDANNNLWLLNSEDTAYAGYNATAASATPPYSTTPDLSLTRLTPIFSGAAPATGNPGISGAATVMATSTSLNTYTGANAFSNASLAVGLAIDGAGDVFVASNYGNAANFINEFNNSAVLLSSTAANTGYVGGSTSTNSRSLTSALFLTDAVDRSGNLWIPNTYTLGADIQVIVGVGAPVTTPILSGSAGYLP